jgi:hypothetical protein
LWYIIPIALGWIEIPKEQSPYLTIIFIFTVLSTNFTNRLELEDDYAKAVATISKIKSELAQILKVIPDSILVLSKTKDIILFNLESQKLFKSQDNNEIIEHLKGLKYSSTSRMPHSSEISLYNDIFRH